MVYCGRRHSCADEIGVKLNSRGRRRGLYSGAKGLVRIRTAAKSVHNSMPTKVDRVGMIHHKNGVTEPTFEGCPLCVSCRREASAFPQTVSEVRVVVADSALIQSQLLARALRARRNFQISTVALEVSALHQFMQSNRADVVLLAGNQAINFGLLRWLHVSHPAAAPVLLVDNYDRDLVVNAFRAGVRGIFLFTHAPFRMLCKCINSVSNGQIWINSQQMHYVLEALSGLNTLRRSWP